jgi:hypothetical protein
MRMETFRSRATVLALLLAQAGMAADWYLGPEGRTTNPGARHAPWDIASALGGREEIRAGDTLLLLEGTYRRRPQELFDVRLEGSAGKPIHVRPVPGSRVRIDGGLAVQAPSRNVWIRGLEIFVSEPVPDTPVSPGSHPPDLKRPHGGLHMHGGRDCKYTNLVIHHCNQGISCWKGEINPEIYGCVIYGNGWLGEDRGHGHCIYTQNDEGLKVVSNCIMTCRYDGTYTMHAYGSSRAYVNNYLVTENICYGRGPFLIGGGRPSRGIRVQGNFLYDINMRIGYDAPHNEDCEIVDNMILNGRLEIVRYRNVVNQGNLVLSRDDERPARVKAMLLPNKYDPNRAHLVIYNWSHAQAVDVAAIGFLRDGDEALGYDPKALYGEPLWRAVCAAGTVRVPITGEFAVFVVIKREEVAG